jgi:hypothetical protein
MKTFLTAFLGAMAAIIVYNALPDLKNPNREVLYRIDPSPNEAGLVNWTRDPVPTPSATVRPGSPQAHRIRIPFPPGTEEKIVADLRK